MEGCLQSLMGRLVVTWKTVVQRAMWTIEAQLKRFLGEKILACGLGTVLVIVWQRMWLLVALVLET